MPKKFEGKVSLVTGGSSGIGRATALAFIREGAQVMIGDIDVQGAQETVSMIKKAGGEANFVKVDVSKASEVEKMVNETIKNYGRIDCAFNNAGIVNTQIVPVADYPENEWERIINTNLKGVFLCMKYEISQMLKQGSGAIVNTSSVFGFVATRLTSACYVASKHGVIGLTKAAALEYAQDNIRINAVCPGWVSTPLTEPCQRDPQLKAEIVKSHPVGRMGTPEEIAKSVLWLCSNDSSFVTGHALVVDGGLLAR